MDEIPVKTTWFDVNTNVKIIYNEHNNIRLISRKRKRIDGPAGFISEDIS